MKDLEKAKSGAEFIRLALRSENLIEPPRKAGSHVTFTTHQGRATVADHKYEFPPYVRAKIRKEFIAIGLVGLIAIMVVGLTLFA